MKTTRNQWFKTGQFRRFRRNRPKQSSRLDINAVRAALPPIDEVVREIEALRRRAREYDAAMIGGRPG